MIRKTRVNNIAIRSSRNFPVPHRPGSRLTIFWILRDVTVFGSTGAAVAPIRRVRLVRVFRGIRARPYAVNVTDRVPFPLIETGRGRSPRNF